MIIDCDIFDQIILNLEKYLWENFESDRYVKGYLYSNKSMNNILYSNKNKFVLKNPLQIVREMNVNPINSIILKRNIQK